MGAIEKLWDLLGKKLFLVFGVECASAAIWMVFALVLRSIIILVRLDNFVPSGVIFAFPYFIQVGISGICSSSSRNICCKYSVYVYIHMYQNLL